MMIRGLVAPPDNSWGWYEKGSSNCQWSVW